MHIPVQRTGPLGTIIFDWKSTLHAAREKSPCLILGYNTAIFTLILRLLGIYSFINMDGIEWSRAKWGPIAKLWFWLNDWAGCWLGNHLIADHPEIAKHLRTRVSNKKITTIAYGAEEVTTASSELLDQWSLVPGGFLTLVARAEPENSILEVVQGFSARPRGIKLVVLGSYSPSHPYQRKVMESASNEVIFAGAIYEKDIVQALRFYSMIYVHGHQVGGTNPSLVEALGAGNAILAHDNPFNRWVAGESALYFKDALSFSNLLEELLAAPHRIPLMKESSRQRFSENFTWQNILSNYETLLLKAY
jgi:glycosyltransferase involved in cell wall biosynthesis